MGNMIYTNMLSFLNCNSCKSRNICFLQRIHLENYPESTQNFVIHLPNNAFTYNYIEQRWHTDFQRILDPIIAYYNSDCDYIPENIKYPLSVEAQKDSDRQFIQNKFKHLLEIAAKETEDSDPKASILFDGIGLVLASDYLEVVHKILSMFHTYNKMINANELSCTNFSADVEH